MPREPRGGGPRQEEKGRGGVGLVRRGPELGSPQVRKLEGESRKTLAPTVKSAGKKDPETSQSEFGERLVRLFVYLLTARRKHKLEDLAEAVGLPESTVHRHIPIIEAAGFKVRHVSYGEDDDFGEYEDLPCDEENEEAAQPPTGKKRVLYWLESLRSGGIPRPAPGREEIEALRMCKAFARRLLGTDLSARAEVALTLMESLAKRGEQFTGDHYAVFTPGTIDYSGKQDILLTLIRAMDERKICRVTYKSPWRDDATIFHIKPLKLFCHKDALYLQTQKASEPGQKASEKPAFDPLLAIHRIKEIEVTDREFPVSDLVKFDFDKAFNRAFGVIKGKEFTVKAEFTDWAATYVEEREWGSTRVKPQRDGDIVTVEFTASSETEVISWILQFGGNGKLIQPVHLVQELKRITSEMKAQYADRSHLMK